MSVEILWLGERRTLCPCNLFFAQRLSSVMFQSSISIALVKLSVSLHLIAANEWLNYRKLRPLITLSE
ncbi:hypothetical protein F7734_50335 [Scytonema sp. UIC 10036]|uniref:hypothetical protein n=1 Tax=Scytonema sp. UIC 10036 TaxID=2304196 RepID=UPI0012DAD07E|nr:hypothetical protein [Scytonema sp. UIC 10036]MUH00043.1 hypothetical protein [Scytonema sp. UIC 10036]